MDERGKIVGWFRQVDDLIRLSQATRSSLRGKFAEEQRRGQEDALSRSPQARMMLSQARPNRYVGMRYLEASRLPWTVPFDADPASKAALAVFGTGVASLDPISYRFQGYKYNRAIMLPTVARVTQAIVGEMSTDEALTKITADMQDAIKQAQQ
jgi:hypothetical protein